MKINVSRHRMPSNAAVRVLVAVVALALTVAAVPSGKPEDVGLSSERLQRINQLVQRYIEVDSRLQRVLAVVKVRASAHSNELRLFHVNDDGIQIGEMLAEYEGQLAGRPTRRMTASAALASMAAEKHP